MTTPVTFKTPTNDAEPLNCGCVVDDHRGQYMIDALANIADDLMGTNYASEVVEYRNIIDVGTDDDRIRAYESMSDMGTEILDQLNELTTGGYWLWDGDIYIVHDDDPDGPAFEGIDPDAWRAYVSEFGDHYATREGFDNNYIGTYASIVDIIAELDPETWAIMRDLAPMGTRMTFDYEQWSDDAGSNGTAIVQSGPNDYHVFNNR